MSSLRTKILTIVLALLVLICAVFIKYAVGITATYKYLRMDSVTRSFASDCEQINKLIAKMERGAINLAIGGALLQSDEIGERLVIENVKGFPEAVGGGIWYEPYAYNRDAKNAGFYAINDDATGTVHIDDSFVMNTYDYHTMDWYREIADNLVSHYQTVWTKPYVDDTGTYSLMTTIGAGIFDQNGDFIGISNVDWEIESLLEELSKVPPSDDSYVLLCDPGNDYVITSTYESAGTGSPLSDIPWDIGSDSFVLEGVTYIAFSEELDNNWFLSCVIPKKLLYEDLVRYNNRYSLIIGFSSVAMLGIAFLLISKLINTPLRRLTDDVAKLDLNNLDVHIDIKTKDELGILAGVFNKMTVHLKESIETNMRERAEKERISAELDLATTIQTSMLPCIFPPFPERPEFDIYASMRPAKEVGGDFYDFFLIDENKLAVVIADVSGKGVPAALFMVIAKTLIKNSALDGKAPGEVFEAVNNQLCENNDAEMFVTAFMGILDIPFGKFSYANAGHNPPLVKRGTGGFERLSTRPCYVLAGIEGTVYKQDEIRFSQGDMLYLYTDGVTEADNLEEEFFTERRLLAELNKCKNRGLKDVLTHISSEIDLFADGAEQADDITMLVMRISEAV